MRLSREAAGLEPTSVPSEPRACCVPNLRADRAANLLSIKNLEAAGVRTDARSNTGRFCEFPKKTKFSKQVNSLKCMGAG